MINFHYEIEFKLTNEDLSRTQIENLIKEENFRLGDINYIFCTDDYLHEINLKYLNHDTYTDIISFDYTVGKELQGDVYISIDRVKENANDFNVDIKDELLRVMFHGVLHYCGYKDKTDDEKTIMRSKEDYYLNKAI